MKEVIAYLEDECIDEDTSIGRILYTMQSACVMDIVEFETLAVEALEQAGHSQVEDLDADDIRKLISRALHMKLVEEGDRVECAGY